MLVDDLIAADFIDNLWSDPSRGRIQARLKLAVKFILAPDFAVVAENLATDFRALAGALPNIRLPFAEMWIEVAQNDRNYFSTAGIHLPALQRKPKRVGFLLTAEDKGLSVFRAHQFWHLPPEPEHEFPKDYL